MRLLFAMSIASFCTVLWIALSLARRIQRDRLRKRPSAQAPAAEFFEGGDYRTPRPIKLNQQVASMRTRPAPVASAATASSPEPAAATVSEPAPSGPVRYLWPSAPATASANAVPASARSVEPVPQSGQIIDSTLELVKPRAITEPLPSLSPARAHSISAVRPIAPSQPAATIRPPSDLSGERKSPQSARSGSFRRVDLSHYNNEDMGDLTDPYTHIVRPSGMRRAVKNS